MLDEAENDGFLPKYSWRSAHFTGKSTALCTIWSRSSGCCSGLSFIGMDLVKGGARQNMSLGRLRNLEDKFNRQFYSLLQAL